MDALVVGLGSIGRRHARNLRTLGVEVEGFDPDPARRSAFQAEIGGAVHADLDAALATRRASLAVIGSPNVFHLEQALACARAGLDLFIEKPLSHSLEGVAALGEEVARRELVMLLGSNWKFHSGPRRVKALVDSGEFGRVLAVQAIGGQYLPDWHPREDYRSMYSSRRALGGGVLLDSHDVDYTTWLAGPVVSVACIAKRTGTLDIETCDMACALLTFAGGACGTLQIDYLQRPYARRLHVTASEGTIIWDYPEGVVRSYRASTGAWDEFRMANDYDVNTMYVDEMVHFLECCRSRSTTVTPFSQALHVLTVLDAAARSAAAGGTPTTL
jgi:predicted dehydrogenase